MENLEFDWDEHNIGHIAAHNVIPEEAEQVLLGDPLDLGFEKDESDEERWSYIGETNAGRILQVVITVRFGKVRVVTAFSPIRRFEQIYLRAKAGEQ